MTRTKKAGKRKLGELSGPSRDQARENKPSEAFKKMLIKLIVDFYESETTMSLQTKYVRYNEECPKKFKDDMWRQFMDAASVPEWQHKTEKSGFDRFLQSRL